ncbi:mitochondrial inner membrane protease ATP23 [Trypanosoma rangeli]|uniref:Mitochondrial inner membrane protease ATP23 n=1 Tax=Trypanosoma rangeli TaxID=5698 RepID=A0A422MWT3_TRYRA|nr:mitochondrial inner membrane protease ATP23 [Trypanosoma rangeli]RNE97639.1 mitochondrial inner membrane protease ATP23 [Trypanosoma rangeli]|eukprot:RNE97639.1 mitochondrial inner membrane protease ATP23 [Trypanosoma rangeli]
MVSLWGNGEVEKRHGTDAKSSVLHEQCEAAVDEVLASVNTVQYLIKSMEEITGIPFQRNRIKCVSLNRDGHSRGGDATSDGSGLSDGNVMAGYMWRRAREDCEQGDILLVEELMVGRASSGSTNTPDKRTMETVERNLRHELIHAFDDARGVIEASDCMHQACSEIRAARLSGDCFVGEELKRGRLDPLRSGMLCVKRRAMLAVEKNLICRGFSERAVDRVFQRCYSDYEPFAAPIYAMGSYGEEQFK